MALLVVGHVHFPLTRARTTLTTFRTLRAVRGVAAVGPIPTLVTLPPYLPTQWAETLLVEMFLLTVPPTTPLLILAKPDIQPILHFPHLTHSCIALKTTTGWVPLTRTRPHIAGL